MNNYTLVNKNHEIIKTLKSLFISSKPKDLYLVEDLFILELIKSKNIEVESFIFCNELEYATETKKIIDYYIENAKECFAISKKTFLSLESKSNSIGFFAIVRKETKELNNLEDIVLVLDRLEQAGNIGTLLRTADACGVKDIILVDKCANINNPKLIKSSRGMVLTENIYELSYSSCLEYLEKNGYDIYLGEPVLGKPYTEYNYPNKTAIVIGHERYGINPDWYNHPHKKVYIPMYGIMTSLNVGVAGSILLYEAKMKKNMNIK